MEFLVKMRKSTDNIIVYARLSTQTGNADIAVSNLVSCMGYETIDVLTDDTTYHRVRNNRTKLDLYTTVLRIMTYVYLNDKMYSENADKPVSDQRVCQLRLATESSIGGTLGVSSQLYRHINARLLEIVRRRTPVSTKKT